MFVPVNFKVPLPDLSTLPLLTTPDIVEVTPLAVSNVIFWPPRLTAPEIVLLLFEVSVYLSPENETSPNKVKVPLLVEFPITLDEVTLIVLLILLDTVLDDDIPPPLSITVAFPKESLFPIPTKPSSIVILDVKVKLAAFNTKEPFPVFVSV